MMGRDHPRIMSRLCDAIKCLENAKNSDAREDEVFYDSLARASEFIDQIMKLRRSSPGKQFIGHRTEPVPIKL